MEAGGTSGGLWLHSDDAPLLRLVQVEGSACLWHPERVADIAADLDAAQPVLDQIEQASGWRFEPEELEAATTDLIVTIRSGETRLELGLPFDLPVPKALLAAAATAPVAPDRPRPTVLTMLTDPLPIEEAEALAPGDLLLLPEQPQVRIAGHQMMAASLDLATGTLASAPWQQAAPRAFGAVIEIALPPAPLAPAALEALGEAPIVLGAPPLNTRVRLGLAGQQMGDGVLVRLAGRYAIRLTDRNEVPAA